MTQGWLEKLKNLPEVFLNETSQGQLETMEKDSCIEAEREATIEPSDEEIGGEQQESSCRSNSGNRIGFEMKI